MSLTEKLHRAIQVEEVEKVKELVRAGAELNTVLGMRGTALCASIEARNKEIVQCLLDSGSNVNIPDYDGEPPLLLALRKDMPGQIMSRKPCLDIVRMLINHKSTNLNAVDPLTRKSAIQFASEQGMAEVVHWLISSERCKINVTDANGNSALHLALYQGLEIVVRELVAHPECLIKVYNRAGLTPFHIASSTGDVKSLQTMIERLKASSDAEKPWLIEPKYQSELVINVNAETYFEKETCLHVASRHAYVEVARLLLENGAAVNVVNNLGNSPLILSLFSEQEWVQKKNDIPMLLLKNGVNLNTRSCVRSRFIERGLEVTPLAAVVINNNVELVKAFVQSGADENLCDSHGRSPLFLALWYDHIEIATYLLRECKGLNVNMRSVEGLTCLHAVFKCALRAQSDPLVQLVKDIIEKGGSLELNNDGKSPIDYAMEYENGEVLNALFEATGLDADRSSIDDSLSEESNKSSLKTPTWIALATEDGLENIIKVLLYHGANIDDRTNNGRSLLYTALKVEEFKIARFFVENGCDLSGEEYLKREDCSKMKENKTTTSVNVDSDESDFDSDTFSNYDTDSADDLFEDEIELKTWIIQQSESPRSLQLSCLVFVRRYFRDNKICFYYIDKLRLPDKMKNILRYKY